MEAIDKVQKTTAPADEDRLCKLKLLYPECLSEGEFDIEKLSSLLLSDKAKKNDDERYYFTWAGKNKAIIHQNKPTDATLIPCREESINFDSSQNIFIEGDNLEVLKILYKPYFDSIKVIYIDPPYNTGGEFVYRDNYAEPLENYLRVSGQLDEEGNLTVSDYEKSGRWHSDWLSMMYPRLFLARQLLSDDGIIFVSIDDHEVHNLRMIMNEIFGEENCLQQVVWQRHGGGGSYAKYFSVTHEYILTYAKNAQEIDTLRRPLTDKEIKEYNLKDEYIETRGPYKTSGFKKGHPDDPRPGVDYEIICPDGSTVSNEWMRQESEFLKMKDEDRIVFNNKNGEWVVEYKLYLKESKGRVPLSLLTKTEKNSKGRSQLLEDINEPGVFSHPKPIGLIKDLLTFSTESDSIVLDFFAGSCTTAAAVSALNSEDGGNRKFILVQLPEPISEKSKAYKLGFGTVADIAKKRSHSICQKYELGLRVFKLAESNYPSKNMKPTDDLPTILEHLEETIDPLREGWQIEDVLFEVALKEGYPLDSPIETVKNLDTNTIFSITSPDGKKSFYICLDEKLDEETPKQLELTKDTVFICRDVALNDTFAANLALQCHLKTL